MIDIVARLKLNLGKRNELGYYSQYHSQLVDDYARGKKKDLEVRYKGLMPDVVIGRSIELLKKDKECLYLGTNKTTKLVISNPHWNIYKVGRHFSIVIPFVTRNVRVPILASNPSHKSLLSDIVTSYCGDELKGDLYIYPSGLDWKVNISIVNTYKELNQLVMI